jgi:hypothetical protein
MKVVNGIRSLRLPTFFPVGQGPENRPLGPSVEKRLYGIPFSLFIVIRLLFPYTGYVIFNN